MLLASTMHVLLIAFLPPVHYTELKSLYLLLLKMKSYVCI